MDDLEHFYTNDLRKALSRLESARKRTLWKFLLMLGGAVAANVLVVLVLEGNQKLLVVFTMIGSLIWFAFFASGKTDRWANDFKSTVISPLLKRIEPSLIYCPDGKIESGVFHASGLYEFSQGYDYGGEDLVTGMLGGVPVSFCELLVTRSGNHGRRTHFQGMFLVADVNVGIDDSVWLLPQGYVGLREKAGPIAGLLSGVLDKMSQRKGEGVVVEDDVFMGLYSVIAENQQAAVWLLTKDVRQKLIEFQQRTDGEVRISFQANRISVALSTEGGHFEPRLTKSILSYDLVRQFAEDLSHVFSIVLAIQSINR